MSEAREQIARLKADLIARGEATELFGQEREQGLASLLANLEQSVLGQPAYPTIESKAAHLLYFAIKNHPFSDGNQRIGSLLFVDFLHQFASCRTRARTRRLERRGARARTAGAPR